jgi:hypothetical protein
MVSRKNIDASTIPTAFAIATGVIEWRDIVPRELPYAEVMEVVNPITSKVVAELAQHDVKLVKYADADWELTLPIPNGVRSISKYKGRFTELTRRAVEFLLPER